MINFNYTLRISMIVCYRVISTYQIIELINISELRNINYIKRALADLYST